MSKKKKKEEKKEEEEEEEEREVRNLWSSSRSMDLELDPSSNPSFNQPLLAGQLWQIT